MLQPKDVVRLPSNRKHYHEQRTHFTLDERITCQMEHAYVALDAPEVSRESITRIKADLVEHSHRHRLGWVIPDRDAYRIAHRDARQEKRSLHPWMYHEKE